MPAGSLGDAFGDLIADLGNRGQLTPRQQAMAARICHVTDIKHAASILASGAVLSRRAAKKQGLFTQETGNEEIIRDQSSWIADCARFYFRPRSPSLFHSEGIRPEGMYGSGVCPVPVCLEFTARSVLNRPGVRFSNGNTIEGNRLRIGSSADDLHILNVPAVYDDGPMPENPTEKDLATFFRHAEVMVPDRLPIDVLVSVAVRTPAERDTLRSLVREAGSVQTTDPNLDRLVRVDRSAFCNFWASVNRCWVDDDRFLTFEFARGICKPQSRSYRPGFDLRLEVETPRGSLVERGRLAMNQSVHTLRWESASFDAFDVRAARLYMDEQLAFFGAPDPDFEDAPCE